MTFNALEQYTIEDEVIDYIATRYFVHAPAENDPRLYGYEAIEYEELPIVLPRVKKEYPRHVVLENGAIAKSYAVYNYPQFLMEGFLAETIPIADRVLVRFEPMPRAKAVRFVNNVRLRLQETLKMNPNDVNVEDMIKNINALADIIRGSGKLMKVHMVFTLLAENMEILKEKETELLSRLEARLLSVEATPYFQKALYEGRITDNIFGIPVKYLRGRYIDTLSLRTFYPFIGNDLIEPNGFLLGINLLTQRPVVINLYSKTVQSYNFVIVARTGGGKSVTMKLLIRRQNKIMEEMGYNYPIYIIDPENEYIKPSVLRALKKGLVPVKLQQGKKLGLDPLVLAERDIITPDMASSVIIDYFKIPDNLSGRLKKAVNDAIREGKTIFDLYNQLEHSDNEFERQLSNYLANVTTDVLSYIFDGEPPNLSRKTGGIVFGLKELYSDDLKALVGVLIASILSNRLYERSLLAVDEGWLFARYPAIMNLLENTARRGRKYGVAFLFATQNPKDLLKSEGGQIILSQASTVLLLRQDDESISVLKSVYTDLSEAEARMLKSASPGQGILRRGNYKTYLYVKPTAKELRIFKTEARPVMRRREAKGENEQSSFIDQALSQVTPEIDLDEIEI
ncbi:VirB4 family type IV secretion system protein [Thermococcus nautili]|uniref:VirB4 family type IV secretion system protein n=1 Tax=Thermococcus nautili TaxID=195522 RepID=UPI002553B603|nr:ATP-binding protein [Thermococcus nautili]